MARVKHAVLMQFRRDASAAAIDEIFADLRALGSKLPGLVDFSGGANESPEGLNQGYTHAFVMTFADAAARDAYLPHPDHEAVKAKIIAVLANGLASVAVLDWQE